MNYAQSDLPPVNLILSTLIFQVPANIGFLHHCLLDNTKSAEDEAEGNGALFGAALWRRGKLSRIRERRAEIGNAGPRGRVEPLPDPGSQAPTLIRGHGPAARIQPARCNGRVPTYTSCGFRYRITLMPRLCGGIGWSEFGTDNFVPKATPSRSLNQYVDFLDKSFRLSERIHNHLR